MSRMNFAGISGVKPPSAGEWATGTAVGMTWRSSGDVRNGNDWPSCSNLWRDVAVCRRSPGSRRFAGSSFGWRVSRWMAGLTGSVSRCRSSKKVSMDLWTMLVICAICASLKPVEPCGTVCSWATGTVAALDGASTADSPWRRFFSFKRRVFSVRRAPVFNKLRVRQRFRSCGV